MPNYLLKDCAQARDFLARIRREPTPLGPYLLLWLTDEEVAQAKAEGLEVWDDLSGEKM